MGKGIKRRASGLWIPSSFIIKNPKDKDDFLNRVTDKINDAIFTELITGENKSIEVELKFNVIL